MFHLFKSHFYLIFSEITISTDRKHPSDSAHQLTLLLDNTSPLTIEVPWPFLVDNVEMSLRRLTPERSFIKLVLQKSLNDPFPIEFGGRSKWDIDRFKRWDAASGMDDEQLSMHLISQFSVDNNLAQLKSKRDPPKQSVLNEVREIIKTIFVATVKKDTFLFSIQSKHNPNPAGADF